MSTSKPNEREKRSFLSTDTVAIYLQEIAKVPMLKPSEEIIHGKKIQQMMFCVEEKEKLEKEKDAPVLHSEWAKALELSEKELKQILRQGSLAKNHMIKANLRLVVSVAKKYLKGNLEFLDLIQEGNLGLERAVEKFDPTKGYRFSTYSYWWIRQGITRAIAKQGRTIRLPVHITERFKQIKKTQRKLSLELGRSATTEEVAQTLGIESTEILECLKIAKQPMSLDMRLGDNKETELIDLIEDKSPSPFDCLAQTSRKEKLEKMLASLKPREREILSLRFGLEDGTEWTLASIGKKMNVSRERARQLQNRALENLRKENLIALRDYIAV